MHSFFLSFVLSPVPDSRGDPMRLFRLVWAPILLMLLMLPVQQACSQTPHSLHWGVSAGQEQRYVLQRKFADREVIPYLASFIPVVSVIDEGQTFTVRFTSFDNIPPSFNAINGTPRAYCNVIRENDTQTVLRNVTGFAVPCGDWEYLEHALNLTDQPGITLINESDTWGYIASGAHPASPEISIYNEVRFDKSNGTLVFLRWRFTGAGTTLTDIVIARWYPGIPTVLPMGIDLAPIILGVIGISLAAVCGVLAYRGFRRPSLMERLGR